MAAPGLTVLLTSDWQCGEPFLPEAAQAMMRLVPRIRPDVFIAAGDLTQRAKPREFQTALELIGRLPSVPVITTPGNHDVPLYRVWERLFAPFWNWKRFISRRLDTVTSVDGATFVTLSSAAPRRAIVNGRLDGSQLDFAERAFDEAPERDARCLVVHHHFVPVPDGEGGRPLPGAARSLERIEAMGVDVVFGGHVHQTHISTSRAVLTGRVGHGVPIVACGTTLSRRGRGVERGVNTLNVVRIGEASVEVTPFRLQEGAAEFQEQETRVLPRPRASGSGKASVDVPRA
jgi:3',5'-cyclic AMP phosphodiesterase CpdA